MPEMRDQRSGAILIKESPLEKKVRKLEKLLAELTEEVRELKRERAEGIGNKEGG